MAASDYLHPDQFGDQALYHGSRSPNIQPGDTIRSWWRQGAEKPSGVMPDNFFTSSLGEARQYGNHVYQVQPTGPSEVDDSRPDAYMSQHPLNVLRKVEGNS